MKQPINHTTPLFLNFLFITSLYIATSYAAESSKKCAPEEESFVKVHALHRPPFIGLLECKWVPKEYWVPIDLNTTTFADINLYFKHLTKAEYTWLTHKGVTVTTNDVHLKNFENTLEIVTIKNDTPMPTPMNRTIPDPMPSRWDPFHTERMNGKYLHIVCEKFKTQRSLFKSIMQRQIDPKSTKPFERW